MKKVLKRIPEERLERCRKARREMQEKYFVEAEQKLGKETVDALRELYSIYNEQLYIWLSGLWDPEIGGFYISESGRDTKGLLPDIESTVQALRHLSAMGMFGEGGFGKGLSAKVLNKLSDFVFSLEDPNDGYFYHPQWGKAITISRRGRDLSWAISFMNATGLKPPYPTAADRLAAINVGGDDDKKLPDHLCDPQKFIQYLEERDINRYSYFVGNQLQAQAHEIKAAGQKYIDILMNWFYEHQRDDNGLWQEIVNYDSVNGLMKIGLIYSAFGIPIPRAEKALESTIFAAMSDQEITFVCQFYNPLVTICNLLRSIKDTEGEDKMLILRDQIIEKAPALIRKTKEKVLSCKSVTYDGVYRYHANGKPSGGVSQGMAVSLKGVSDDINGCTIAVSGVLPYICSMLGLPTIPIYSEEDRLLFNELLETAEQYPKINEYPGDDYYYGNDSWFAKEVREKKELLRKGEL